MNSSFIQESCAWRLGSHAISMSWEGWLPLLKKNSWRNQLHCMKIEHRPSADSSAMSHLEKQGLGRGIRFVIRSQRHSQTELNPTCHCCSQAICIVILGLEAGWGGFALLVQGEPAIGATGERMVEPPTDLLGLRACLVSHWAQANEAHTGQPSAPFIIIIKKP